MKTLLRLSFIFLVLIYFQSRALATVWTVSNDPNRPAQFTNLQDAVDAASPGDTLRIAGSNTEYTGVELFFPMVWIGEGASNPDGFSTSIGGLRLKNLNSSLGSSGSKFFGIAWGYAWPLYGVGLYGNFTGQTAGVNNRLSDIQFERCTFQYEPGFSDGMFEQILFRHCYFQYGITFSSQGPYSGVVVTNSVFFHQNSGDISGPGSNYPLGGGVIIRNCLFNQSTSNAFDANNLFEIIVENCIFYKSEPTGAQNSVFNNNITYLCNNNTLPYGSNAGSGNLSNVNPLYVDYPALGGSWSWAYDFGLQAGSPAIGTGTNGTNIGLTGGNAPINNIPGYSRIPVVTELTLPSTSVPVGGNLPVQVKAKTRN